MNHTVDQLVFVPDDVDLRQSPLAGHLGVETFVLGAFNPALTRLPNGNLLMMVRVAEALQHPVKDGFVHAIDGKQATMKWRRRVGMLSTPGHLSTRTLLTRESSCCGPAAGRSWPVRRQHQWHRFEVVI